MCSTEFEPSWWPPILIKFVEVGVPASVPTELLRPAIFEAETIAWPKVTACVAGRFEIEITLPLTALLMSVMA